ncbi:hypothetical protein [Sphingobacterium sp.]|uniref:hypothetical protein n=1 Tax=Sphingobacterium sp. TaxID=341027 RepID=UPI0028B0768E|nr:hypothetical protein [Sphingobacterium sp.]
MEDLTKNKKDSKAETAKELDIEKKPSATQNQETDLEKELRKELDSYKNENADLNRMLEGKEVEVKDLKLELENTKKELNEANALVESFNKPESLKDNKSVVIAVKGDQERTFPKLAWDALPADKSGWQIKVETPEEAK